MRFCWRALAMVLQVDWSGNIWLPENLLYVTAKFSGFWNSWRGIDLRNWAIANRRPLLWADDDDSGMVRWNCSINGCLASYLVCSVLLPRGLFRCVL